MTEKEVRDRYAEAAKAEGYDPDPTDWKPGPGRYQAEPAEVLYYNSLSMDGNGEDTYACDGCWTDTGDCGTCEPALLGKVFEVDLAEAKVFGIRSKRIMLTFSDQGFLGIVYIGSI